MSTNPAERMFVILNPHAGRRRAQRRIETFLRRHGDRIELQETESPGHARRLARQAALDGYRHIVAAGGDGTVHEVACGLIDSKSTDVCLQVVPIGSANDFAWSIVRNTHIVRDNGLTTQTPKSKKLCVDVGKVVRAGLPTEYFIESFGSGLSGCVTVESRKIEKLQGMPLYTLATLRALNSTTPMPMEIVSDGQLIKQPTLLFSVMNGKREGSFMLAPNAQMNDGWFDYVHARDVGWYQALGLLPRIALFGTPSNHPRIGIGRCRSIQIRTDWNLTIHIDGEILARPEDGVREVGIEILPARLQVELLDV